MTEYSRKKQIYEKHEINADICRLKCEILRLTKDSHRENRRNEGQIIIEELITDIFFKMVKNRGLQITEVQ